MAWALPGAGELRRRVRFQRLATTGNVGGVDQTAWSDLGVRSAKLQPSRGGEDMIAGRLQGTAPYECWVRFDSLTRTLQASDRCADDEAGVTYEIGWAADPDGGRAWVLLQLTRRS